MTTCATCTRFRASSGARGELMPPWGNCVLGKSYEWLSPRRECQFEPSRWEKK